MLTVLPAHAWGNLGHRVTGMIADSQLNEVTQREVTALLDGESLADAATYMDRERESLAVQFPVSPRWHYDNVPVCGQNKRDKNNHCGDGNCASAQIARWQQTLADRRAPRASRALALRLLAHLVGDLHQPLHAADHDDRGGNEVMVQRSPGPPQNLHTLLDTTLVRQVAGKRSAKQLAQQWRKRFAAQLPAWRRGTPAQWLAESHALAVHRVYSPLPGFSCQQDRQQITINIDEAYVQPLEAVIPEQLTKAGMRLAQLLNQTLS